MKDEKLSYYLHFYSANSFLLNGLNIAEHSVSEPFFNLDLVFSDIVTNALSALKMSLQRHFLLPLKETDWKCVLCIIGFHLSARGHKDPTGGSVKDLSQCSQCSQQTGEHWCQTHNSEEVSEKPYVRHHVQSAELTLSPHHNTSLFLLFRENEALWREISDLRQKHSQQQQLIKKVRSTPEPSHHKQVQDHQIDNLCIYYGLNQCRSIIILMCEDFTKNPPLTVF